MAYTTVITHATGDVFPAADWNTYIRDNLAYLHGDAGVIAFGNDFGAGSASTAVGATPGVLLTHLGEISAAASGVGNVMLSSTVIGDAGDYRFVISAGGALSWGPGSGARDTFLTRNAAGILQIGTTTAPGTLYLFGSIGGSNSLAAFVAAETQARWAVQADGTTSWGPGGATVRDTTLGRSAAGQLNVLNKVMEALPAAATVSVPSTFTPGLANGPVQRCNVTAGGAATLTIAAPTSPPSSIQTSFLVVRIANTGGGTITLSWNGAFIAGPTLALPASVATGSRTSPLFFWDGANWQLLSLA